MPSTIPIHPAEPPTLPPQLPDGRHYIERLSPRERQVLDLIYAGGTNKGVAIRLGISEKTIEKHRSRLMEKMEVKSFAELIRLTFRETEVS